MLKLINTTGATLTANDTIPLNVKYNTNDTIGFDASSNSALIKLGGVYNIDGDFVLTSGVTGDITIQMYINGVAVPEAKATITTTTGNTYTYTIVDAERFVNIPDIDYSKISFVVTGASILISADVKIERLK